MGGDPTTVAGSDHGFAPQWYAVNASNVLNQATVGGVSLHASGGGTSNCSAIGGAPVAPPTAPSRRRHRQGVLGRRNGADLHQPEPAQERRAADLGVVPDVRGGAHGDQNAFASLTDPANPGKQVILKIMNKEELRNVDGSDSLHPSRSGDVVVVTRPPYQWDAATANVKIALSRFFGQHGYLPNTVDMTNNINMHSTFVAGGPGFKDKKDFKGVRQIDLAPTLAFMMGIPGPQQARGRDPLRRGQARREPQRDDDPRHQRLARAADAARRDGGQPRGPGRERVVLDRWRGVPQAVVRRLRGRVRAHERTRTSRASSRSPPATRSAVRRRRSRPSSATSRRSES